MRKMNLVLGVTVGFALFAQGLIAQCYHAGPAEICNVNEAATVENGCISTTYTPHEASLCDSSGYASGKTQCATLPVQVTYVKNFGKVQSPPGYPTFLYCVPGFNLGPFPTDTTCEQAVLSGDDCGS